MKIKNFESLATNKLRKDALEIVEAGLEAIDTTKVIESNIKLVGNELKIAGESFNLKLFKKVYLVGVGKCALEASLEIEKILGEKLTDGVVVDVKCFERPKRLKFCLGSHPLPSDKNIDATKMIIEMLEKAEVDDLVIFVISGGGSVLLCQPENFTCNQESEITKFLFDAGATIQELNTVRKHISLARGGWLAKHAYPARGVALIFSDVPGNHLSFIASGPTVLDETTVDDAREVINKYKVWEKYPYVTKNLLETPKDPKYFDKISNLLIVSNQLALGAMSAKAQALGYSSLIKNNELIGDAKLLGQQILNDFKSSKPNSVWLYGGESTVRVKGRGVGGRNQTLALSGLKNLVSNELLIALASDGRDNSDFAGAICDKITLRDAEKLNCDPKKYLEDDDSFGFFKKVGNYLDAGYLGSNVSDLILVIK